MKFISWNVNGLRAVCAKGFNEIFASFDADFVCIQETKLSPGALELEFEGYRSYWNLADRKGYSGTAIYTRHEPVDVTYGIGVDEHDHEGRVITLNMGGYYLVNVYTPNSQGELARLPYRMVWEEAFRKYIATLDARKPVIICGDMNVAHKEIDLKNPKTNRRNAGLQMKSVANLPNCLPKASLIRSGLSIRIWRMHIHGGAIVQGRVRRMSGGVLTIFL